MELTENTLVHAGIYYGVHCLARVTNLTLKEAKEFFSRKLNPGEQWSINHTYSNVAYIAIEDVKQVLGLISKKNTKKRK